jgi:5-methylcytosine-specific restriction enzyme B
MARVLKPGAELIYSAAERFVQEALKTDGSIFTPGLPIWSAENLNDLNHRFVEQPDEEAGKGFETKFAQQLEGAPAPTCQLAAECIYVYYLIDGQTRGDTKRDLINAVLSWSPDSSAVQLPHALDSALDHGLLHGGAGFLIHRPFLLWLLIEFARRWKALAPTARGELLEEPFEMKEFLRAIPVVKAQAMREALLHLLFPDTFERIISKDQKKQIVRAWPQYVPANETDVDRKILAIRGALQNSLGRPIDFYDKDILPQWSPADKAKGPAGPQTVGSTGAWIFQGNPKLYDVRKAIANLREMTWLAKQHVSEMRIGDVVYLWESGEDGGILGKATLVGEPREMALDPAELPYVREPGKFEGQQVRARLRIDRTLEKPIPRASIRANPLLTELAIVRAPEGSNFRVTKAEASEIDRLMTSAAPLPCFILAQRPVDLSDYGADAEGSRYHFDVDVPSHLVLRRSVPARFVYYRPKSSSRDHTSGTFFGSGLIQRIDAADTNTFVAALADYAPLPRPVPRTEFSPAGWNVQNAIAQITPEDFDRILQLGGLGLRTSGPPVAASALPFYELDDDDPVMATVDALLADGFGGVVFAGPPGTSKTWYAFQVAARIVEGDSTRFRNIQFHPSYQYEDFVEGFRPKEGGGFELVPRHLLQICEMAKVRPERRFVLLIDELSRSDPARVFGEALTYLEYSRRGIPFVLASGRKAEIPANVVVIATMNVFDRGVDEVDAAFERRFGRVEMAPSEVRLKAILERNAVEQGLADRITSFFAWLLKNGNRYAQIGHAYFANVKDDESARRLWENQLRFVLEKAYRLEPEGFRGVEAAWRRAFPAPSPSSVDVVVPAIETTPAAE